MTNYFFYAKHTLFCQKSLVLYIIMTKGFVINVLMELSSHQKYLTMSHYRKVRCVDILLKKISLSLKKATIGFLFKKFVSTIFKGEALFKSQIFSVKFYDSMFFSFKKRREWWVASSWRMVPLFVPTPSQRKTFSLTFGVPLLSGLYG